MTDLFSGIEQATLPLGAGQAPVPLFYRDLAYLGIYLLAPLDKVRGLLPSRIGNGVKSFIITIDLIK